MRKILAVILLALTISLVSCKDKGNDLPIVVCTIFPQYDIVRSLASEYVDLHMAVLPGVDTHNYDPSVDDMILIKKSALFVYTGDFMENWASTIGASNPLDLSKVNGIELSQMEEKHEHHEDHKHDIDPHIWTSLTHLKYMVHAISEKLQAILPDHINTIKTNEQAYINKLDLIINQMNQIKEQAKDKTFYFGTPFAFYYLFKEFDLNYHSVYVTCSMEVDPSIDDIIEMNNIIKDNNVPVIYVKELTSRDVAESIVSGTNCQIVELHSGHNLSKEDFEKGVTLLSLIEKNVNALKRALV
jgi:zinc transport system substrate-binding protein